jgi:hypothetical protein
LPDSLIQDFAKASLTAANTNRKMSELSRCDTHFPRDDKEMGRFHHGPFLGSRLMMDEKSAYFLNAESFSRESWPFCSLLVKSVGNCACQGAILTIWNMKEEDKIILKEGNIVNFQNLGVSSKNSDGILQLIAQENTQIRAISKNTDSLPSQFIPRSFVPIFVHHSLSRRLCTRQPSKMCRQDIDIFGWVVQTVYANETLNKIYLTDESCLVSRIDFNGSDVMKINFGELLAFRDVTVMVYDYVENCAIATFTKYSTICSSPPYKPCHHGNKIEIAAAAIQSQLAIHYLRNIVPGSVAVAVGRIVGVGDSIDESTFIILHVDTGSASLNSWKVPLFLFHDLEQVISENLIHISPAQSIRATNSSDRQKVMNFFGLLLQFVLQENNLGYEVRQIKVADEKAHAILYSRMNRTAISLALL